jgi:hypothetical protein
MFAVIFAVLGSLAFAKDYSNVESSGSAGHPWLLDASIPAGKGPRPIGIIVHVRFHAAVPAGAPA